MSRIILTNESEGESADEFCYTSEFDHACHIESGPPRTRVYLNTKGHVVIDVTMGPTPNSALREIAERALERALVGREKRQRAQQLSARASVQRSEKRARRRDHHGRHFHVSTNPPDCQQTRNCSGGLLARNVETRREVLRTLIVEPYRFTPVIEERRRGYRFTATLALDRVVSGVIELPKTLAGMASPTGFDTNYQPVFRGEWHDSRHAA